MQITGKKVITRVLGLTCAPCETYNSHETLNPPDISYKQAQYKIQKCWMIILAYEALNNIVEVVGMFSIKAITVVKSIHTQIVEGQKLRHSALQLFYLFARLSNQSMRLENEGCRSLLRTYIAIGDFIYGVQTYNSILIIYISYYGYSTMVLYNVYYGAYKIANSAFRLFTTQAFIRRKTTRVFTYGFIRFLYIHVKVYKNHLKVNTPPDFCRNRSG